MKNRGTLRRALTILAVFVLLGTGLPFLGVAAGSHGAEEIDLPPMEKPAKGHSKLDSVLDQLVSECTREGAAADAFARNRDISLTDGHVRVIIEYEPTQAQAACEILGERGVNVESQYDNLVRVSVALSDLLDLASDPAVRHVRLPRRPTLHGVSEGASLVNVDEWYGDSWTGAGVKVGIVDIGFSGYGWLLGNELPASVTTHWLAFGGTPGLTQHGTACAEIIHDIAPDAELYLVNIEDGVDWGNAIDWLVAQQVDVISCSLGFLLWGPGDGTGYFCDKVADAAASGVLFVTSAGNYAEKHWHGYWYDPDWDSALNYCGIDETDAIYASAGDTIRVMLRWDDPWGQSANDYNLYLYDASISYFVASSLNPQDGDDDPVEHISTVAPYTGDYHIVVKRWSADGGSQFHLLASSQELEYQVASGSLDVPADSPHALTVGAVSWLSPSVLESFSSQGPTDDGRMKPDLVAPDGVSTWSYGPSAFSGTSASTPHAAGAAALVKQAYPAYSPAEVKAFLEGRAVDLGVAGKDNEYGAGRLDLGEAPQNPSGLPCGFYGTVQVDGCSVPDATVITAMVGGDEYSTTTPAAGCGNSTYALTIDPTIGTSYTEGAEVTFAIGGCTADQTGLWVAGGNIELNLSTATSSGVEIGTFSSYWDTLGYLHIVGEVVNNTDSNAEFVKIVATFYDALENVIGTDFAYTELDILVPGQRSPFDLSSYPDHLPNLDHYALGVDYRTTAEAPFAGLEVLSHSSQTNTFGDFEIAGEVRNNSATAAEFVKLVATYYAANGTVIGTDYAFTEFHELGPGQTSPFEISSWPREVQPDNYSVQVQGRAASPSPTPTPEPPALGYRELQVAQGWNLVSIPLTPSNSAIDVLLAGIQQNVDCVWGYDNATKTWSSYIPDGPFPSLTQLVDCAGYWIKMKAADTLRVEGTSSLLYE